MRRLGERFLSGTAMSGPSGPDPFAGFGMTAAGTVAPRRRTQPVKAFDVAEARARIADFAGNSYKPRSLQEMVTYLAERFLRIESRRQVNGQFVNYLVDVRTKVALLAAAVDRRLSSQGIAQMFGRTVDAEAEVRRRRLQDAPEMVDARVLRGELAASFHRDGLVPDSDWESFEVTMAAMGRGRVVMAQGNEIVVGFEAGRASEDPAENLRLMRKLQAEGRRCFFPALTAEDARAGRLVPGMPVVLREGAVRTRMIDPDRLSMQALQRKFGQSFYDYYASRPRREALAGRDAAPSNVLDIQKFVRRSNVPAIAKVAPEPVPAHEQAAPRRASGNGAIEPSSRYFIRHELERGGSERLLVVDRQSNEARDLGDTALPAGRYQKQDVFGMPDGFLVVDSEGGYAHRDAENRYHNPYGPAVVPPEGSGGRLRYAVRDEFMAPSEFEARNAVPVQKLAVRRPPPPEPEILGPDEGPQMRLRG